ncbi:MAG: DNA mismatch repair protein MutS [Planctomycetota bacterium]
MIREDEDSRPTPLMRQYLAVKEQHPKELLFFRMGDFYEMFFEDAKEASAILGIALTSRSKEKDAVPMAGVPVRSAETYLARLLRAGKRVAICEQLEDPKNATGLVDRGVVRVISPGTVTSEKIVGEKSHNFIAALLEAGGKFGLAWLDVTTGQFLLWETRSLSALTAQLSKLEPAECLLPESLQFRLRERPELEKALESTVLTPSPDPHFEEDAARRTLNEHFGTRSLEGFGCEHLSSGVSAGGALLRYVSDTQKDALQHIAKVLPYRDERHVPIDRATRRALELTESQRTGERAGSLLGVLDRTWTAPGARLIREWLLEPLTDVAAVAGRQEAVAELVADAALRDALADRLRRVHDLERLSTRLSYRSATARDLVAIAKTLEAAPGIRELLEGRASTFLRERAGRVHALEDLRREIDAAFVECPPLTVSEGGMVREGYDAELDDLKGIAQQGTRWIAKFQEEEIRRTGIPTLKVGYNRVFGYYIEVTNAHRDKIPAHYARKQTLKNCERFVTPELKDYETKVLSARERAVQREYEIFVRIRDDAARHIPLFQETAQALAEVDAIQSFAAIAAEGGWVRPAVHDGLELSIEDGRHPVVERLQTSEPFVPNSVDLDSDRNIMIITGPNMAGKSTYIRQVAILTLLAQIGSYVPAKRASVGIADRIFTRVGASDDIARGQSTFMVEMYETANILNSATPRSLVILDEVGRGTSTFDGVSLAWAITEHIAERVRARTLFATHYHELTELALTTKGVVNYNFAVKEWKDDIVFLRKIVPGGSDRSYGIHVARLAGIPREVIERAKEILSNLESQALDVNDRPALASRRGAEPPALRQLDLFHDANAEILKELKRLDLDRLTPLEALSYLAEIQKRII